MKPQTLSTLGRSPSAASWLLLLLGLAACQPPSSDVDEPSETGSTTTDEASGTSGSIDPDGTTGSTSSETDTSDTGADERLPDEPALVLGFSQVKQFDFSWDAVEGAEHYRLFESSAPGEPLRPISGELMGESLSLTMPLVARQQASYVLHACNEHGCTQSASVDVMGSLATAVGYFKASNTGASDQFGDSVVLSGDGSTLVVGAPGEDGGATGIDGDQADDSAVDSGAVYVFVRDELGRWSQQAYLKASNSDPGDQFGAGYHGRTLALSRDGSTLAVGAWGESSSATGIDGDQADDSAPLSGAVYVFVRDGLGRWSQQAYVKASDTDASDLFGASVGLSSDGNTLAVGAPYGRLESAGAEADEADPASRPGTVYVFTRGAWGWSQQAQLEASNAGAGDELGHSLALSGDGNTLAVGAPGEASGAMSIGGDQADDSAPRAGAVYVFVHEGLGGWSQQAYLKAFNTDADDHFGWSLALGLDGDTLAVGAPGESSGGSSLGGDPHDDSRPLAGAAYVFVREGLGAWSQQAYLKASNADADDRFGQGVALSDDGSTLAVGAHHEASIASGLGGDQANDAAGSAGAAYVLVRDADEHWSQRAYVKAPNPSVTPLGDRFGSSLALSGNGGTLAVGAPFEDGGATGIGGDASDDSVGSAGAVHLY